MTGKRPSKADVERGVSLLLLVIAITLAGADQSAAAPDWITRGSGVFQEDGREVVYGVSSATHKNRALAVSLAFERAEEEVKRLLKKSKSSSFGESTIMDRWKDPTSGAWYVLLAKMVIVPPAQGSSGTTRETATVTSSPASRSPCPPPAKDEDSFAEVVKSFRTAGVKPKLPREAHKFDVQAKFAVEQKRFEDAAARYADALKVVPWWPQARYNRAVILSKLSRYDEAIREMKRYLLLVPKAPDARQAQDMIYAWESAPR